MGAHTSSNEAPVRIFAKLRDTATESGDGFDAPGMAPNDAVNPPPTDSSGSAYGELNTESAHRLFPELALIPRVTILYMNFMLVNCDSPIRISAFGAEDGWIGVFQTNMTDRGEYV
ncbi:unnamed protein product [Dicrocoelium dendriticum]|nr:unnamed protein product [Dicrocoelium dendriticum]